MRQTCLYKLQCTRDEPFNPDKHDIIEQRGGFQYSLADKKPGEMRLKITFQIDFVSRADGKRWARFEGEAGSTITDASIKIADNGEVNADDHVQSLVQGAVQDDVFLPLSILARSMRLPSFLVFPPLDTTDQPKPDPAAPSP